MLLRFGTIVLFGVFCILGACKANESIGHVHVVGLTIEASIPAGAICAYGGRETRSGFDKNADCQLDRFEVTSILYTCNGASRVAESTPSRASAAHRIWW